MFGKCLPEVFEHDAYQTKLGGFLIILQRLHKADPDDHNHFLYTMQRAVSSSAEQNHCTPEQSKEPAVQRKRRLTIRSSNRVPNDQPEECQSCVSLLLVLCCLATIGYLKSSRFLLQPHLALLLKVFCLRREPGNVTV